MIIENVDTGEVTEDMSKNIVILGSTGSIGTQTLEIVDENQDLKVIALSANKSVDKLENQIREYNPKYAVMHDEQAAKDLAIRVKDHPVKVLAGMDGLITISTLEEIDTVVTAIVGMIGIRPTIAAMQAGKTIALANKETLVCAGHIIMPLSKEKNIPILPVDSEHSAIFQSLQGNDKKRLDKILLTASGGPFRGRKAEELVNMTAKDALKHPNWSMGQKITIDSATMVNKGLEVMEAKWLFDVELEDITVVVQPQSIIHSMVQYVDGSIIAQLGTPDMKLPIQYALFYPDRRPLGGKRVDFFDLERITFEKPDFDNFRGLALAFEAAKQGGSMPTVFNAANESAVALFLNNEIKFLQIAELIEEAMQGHKLIENPTVEQILEAEKVARETVLLKK